LHAVFLCIEASEPNEIDQSSISYSPTTTTTTTYYYVYYSTTATTRMYH
jgi:hypothetical protein